MGRSIIPDLNGCSSPSKNPLASRMRNRIIGLNNLNRELQCEFLKKIYRKGITPDMIEMKDS